MSALLREFDESSRIDDSHQIRKRINHRGAVVVQTAFGCSQSTASKFMNNSEEIAFSLDKTVKLLRDLDLKVVDVNTPTVPRGWVTMPLEWAQLGFIAFCRIFGARGAEQKEMRRLFLRQRKSAPLVSDES